MPHATILLNQRSGAGADGAQIIAAADAALRSAGYATRASALEPDRLAEALAATDPARTDLLVVGGGDGTILTAADRAIQIDRPIAILPMGTMNLVAKDLNLPLDPLHAAAALAQTRETAIDVALANGRLFLHSALLGIAPALGAQRERFREAASAADRVAAAAATIETLASTPPLELALHLGEDRFALSTFLMAVTANRLRAALPAPLARDALDAGELGIYWSTHEGRAGLTQLLGEIGVGLWVLDPRVERRAVPSLTVEAAHETLNVSLDGENTPLQTPLRFEIRPRALRVRVPHAGALPPAQ